jgi:hypothetical protein
MANELPSPLLIDSFRSAAGGNQAEFSGLSDRRLPMSRKQLQWNINTLNGKMTALTALDL